jgi:hypothetical protein
VQALGDDVDEDIRSVIKNSPDRNKEGLEEEMTAIKYPIELLAEKGAKTTEDG